MTSVLLEFFVPGFARPKGSLNATSRIGSTKVRMVEQVDPEGIWRKRCLKYAHAAAKSQGVQLPLTDQPTALAVLFLFDRPDNPKFPNFPATTSVGDVDKLARNIFDALTPTKSPLSNRVLIDDSRFVNLLAHKDWAAPTEEPGAFVQILTATKPSRAALNAYLHKLRTSAPPLSPLTSEQELFG